MMHRTYVASFSLGIAFVLASQSGVAAEYKSPVWGGSGGDRAYNMDCGSRGVVVGVSAKWGLWIDQLGVICRRIRAGGTLGSAYSRGPVGGQGGFNSRTTKCVNGAVLVEVTSRAGIYVNSIALVCKDWNAKARRAEGAERFPLQVGAPTCSGPGCINASFTCGSDQVVKALRGRSGGFVDSLQVVCDQWNR